MSLFPDVNDYNLTSPVEFLQYINEATDVGMGGILGIVMLLGITFLTFLASKVGFSFERSMVFACFVGIITAILLYTMSLLSIGILSVSLIIFVIGIYFLSSEGSSE